MYWDERVTKLCKKCPLHLKYVLYLGKFEVTDLIVNAVLTCIF